ncbi:peritrophin-1-like [Cotesia typhae]|uniref:peritrophin-1-like n=1 Tax=Cotesia typhae TaxID=2053667 RepID=UPI003D6905DC
MKVIIAVFIVGLIGTVNCLNRNLLIRATEETPKPTTTTTTSSTPKPPVDCDAQPDNEDEAILLPNPVNCESYYVCVGLDPILMPCPDGLHFNPKLKVCDWPDVANCTYQF